MAGHKGTTIVFVRNLISKAGPDKEKEFLALLNEEERKVWEKTLAFHWVPIEMTNKVLVSCCKVLYPDQSQDEALYAIGIGTAKEDINKVYRMIFKIISPETIIKKAASMWRTYHQAGDCTVRIIEKGRASDYEVKNYPDLPKEFVQGGSGYIHGLVEIGGRKNVKVVKQKQATGWCWHISYDNS